MGYENGYSLSDIAAATGNGNNGNSGFGNGDGAWLIILFLIFALGGWGNRGGFGGNGGSGNGGVTYVPYNTSGFGGGADSMYAWLSNGQKEIMQNTNNGFDTLHLSNQIEGVKDSVNNISTQICNGFSSAEISANARQMADMNQNFNNQIATLQGFNGLQSQLAQCCCDNRLATCQTQNIVQNEGNATRFADANNTRDIITNATSNTQAILDKLCQLELDGYKRENDNLRNQLTMADLRASQTAQNAFISQGFANEVDQLYNRLNSCPVPSTPVFRKNTNIYLQQ